MNKLTTEEIKTGIEKIECLYLLDILDTILRRFDAGKLHIINRDIEGIQWEINCINPYGELYPEKIP